MNLQTAPPACAANENAAIAQRRYSILVAAYNAQATIRRSLDSIVAAKKGHDVELIVIDDGSTDQTSTICADYVQRYPWIKLIVQVNTGVAEVRNRLLQAASGTHLAFVDADDAIEERYFDFIDDKLRETGADMVVFGHNRITQSGVIQPNLNMLAVLQHKDIMRLQLCVSQNPSIYLFGWARVFARELATGFTFDPKIRLGEDTAINLYTMNRACRVCVFPDCAYNYYQTPGSITSNTFKPALLESFEAHYAARVNAHQWPPAGTVERGMLEADIAADYVERILLHLLDNLRHLPLSEQWAELKRIRRSSLYENCIPHYAQTPTSPGVRFLVTNFLAERYLLVLAGLWLSRLMQLLRTRSNP